MLQTDDPLLHIELILKSVLCFALQIALIYLIFYDPEANYEISQSYLQLNIARLVTATLLHIVVMPEVAEAINLMQYSINNYDKFKTRSFMFPFLIAFMKLFGAFFTEFINMVKITTAGTVDDVVKDFIAFAIIAEIDNILGQTLKSVDKKDSLDSQDVKYDKKLESKSFLQHCEDFIARVNCGASRENMEGVFIFLAMVFYKLVNTVYIIFYFYFFPMLIVFLIFMRDSKTYEIETIDIIESFSN